MNSATLQASGCSLDPDAIAAEIAEDLRTALEEFEAIQGDVRARAE